VLTIGPASFAENSGVTSAVRDKCKVQEELPEESIFAPGGGRYSGPKQIVAHGDVIEAGQVTASFDVKRSTTRATRTCAMLDKVNTAISKDVKKWLKKPQMGAQLGELK
jgi:hypothetical protein